VNVGILLPFKVLATEMTMSVVVQLHVRVKLVLLGECFVAALLLALEVSAVLPCEMSSESCERELDGDVAHVALVGRRLLPLLLVRVRFFCLLRFMMSFAVMPEVLLVLEELVTLLALEGVVVLVALLVSLSV